MEGWIKLHRKFLEWEWFDSDNMVKMFIYLLLSANTKDKRWRGMIVKRGQLVTSRASLSERLNISERSVRTCIARLVDGGEITTKSTNKFTILTICKYEQYQQVKNDSRPTNDQQTTNKRPQLKKVKKVEKVEKVKKNISTTSTARARTRKTRFPPTISWHVSPTPRTSSSNNSVCPNISPWRNSKSTRRRRLRNGFWSTAKKKSKITATLGNICFPTYG